jgi:hypothetical protein
MKKWSRRKFLEAGVAGSMAVGRAAKVALSSVQEEGRTPRQPATTVTLGAREQKLLLMVMDEIIPAGDGMPAMSEVGGLDYLNRLARREQQAAKDLQAALEALEALGRQRFQASFLSLTPEHRVEALAALEQQSADSFSALRDYIYEAYYTQPEVWKLIGYEFRPTNQGGPPMKPFDEAALAEVRRKPRYYRET